MVIKNIVKYFLMFVFLLNASYSYADTLDIKYNQNSISLTTKEAVKNTVFTRFNDIWIIFSEKNLKVKFDNAKLAAFGVTQVEELIMKNSKGYRLRFAKQAPAVEFINDYENRTVTIDLTKQPTAQKATKAIKYRVENVNAAETVKNLYLDSVFILDYAYSIQTGEKYLISISNDPRLKYPTEMLNNGLLFVPTYSGSAMVSENGEFLTIEDEYTVKLSDTEDLFFDRAVTPNLETEINNFFKNTGIQLLERQLRDYSVFNEEVKDFKPTGDYEDAYSQLNKALDLIDKFNYSQDLQKLNPVTTRRLESISIIEGEIEDQSSEDDGFFEVKEKAKEELNVEKEDDQDVLVPNFADENLPFLLSKLRLSAIKEPSIFKKEQINIKRMQILAYKSYYAEMLDMSKMLRTEISGEFPKNNKALALFTLANAQMNRCKETISLPEISGSVYTKDIKLWKAYCFAQNKNYKVALDLFESEYDRIQTYPKKLKTDLLFAFAKSLQGVDKYLDAIELLKKLQIGVDEKTADEIKYQLALSYLYSNETQMALNEFKSLVYSKNLPIRYQARLDYLNMLLQDKETKKETILEALEELRFDFRDGQTELDATKSLASLYLQEDYIKKAMDLYKYISIYFPDTPSAKHATETLFNVFYNLFSGNQQTSTNLNMISKIALFYDFIELTPSDYSGNKIITNVVDNLIDLELYDNAIKLLTVQLNYKTEDPDLAQDLGEKLAELYLKTGQVKNAFRTLILTQKNPDDSKYTETAKMIKAKAFLQSGDNKNAEELLKKIDNSLDAKYTLAGIYWDNNDYLKIIGVLENIFLGKKVDLNEEGIINLSYLMVAYSLTNNAEKLYQIKDLYQKELESVNLLNKLDFLLKLTGEDVQIQTEDKSLLDTWQKVIDIDNNVAQFIEKYQQEADFRKALDARDYDTLIKKYANRLN